jgi:peptidoglycan/LPS O-acetylase OafA/YrhL
VGFLRTLFAITVLLGHMFGDTFIGGRNAVQLFYMISGYLISFVLIDAKSYLSVKDFYLSRFLRVYPIYFAVAFLTLAAYLLAPREVEFFHVIRKSPDLAKALLIFSNLFLFLQDWVMFSGVELRELVFATNFQNSEIILYKGLLVPQAWTLGVELSFYIVAPFILKKRFSLFLFLFLSICLRVYFFKIGIGANDPWTYRFFPTELALFLFGAIAHQFVMPWYKKYLAPERLRVSSNQSVLFLVLFTLFFDIIPLSLMVKTILLFLIFFLLLPFVFLFKDKWGADKWIGELSYPIYICHILVINVVSFFSRRLAINDSSVLGFLVVIGSILFSFVLIHYVSNPLEKFRTNFRKI